MASSAPPPGTKLKPTIPVPETASDASPRGEIIAGVDHKFLNDQAPFDAINPSAENIAKYFYDETAGQVRDLGSGARIASITVWETDTTAAPPEGRWRVLTADERRALLAPAPGAPATAPRPLPR